jgi:hypothetical protein
MPKTSRTFLNRSTIVLRQQPTPGYIHTVAGVFHFLCCGPGIWDSQKSLVFIDDTILIVLAIDDDDDEEETYTFFDCTNGFYPVHWYRPLPIHLHTVCHCHSLAWAMLLFRFSLDRSCNPSLLNLLIPRRSIFIRRCIVLDESYASAEQERLSTRAHWITFAQV